MSNVIVFGPTGSVGSVAARTAQEKGAKVWLAMRDPQKPIPGLSAEQERDGGFERVQADLTKPDTIAAAVKKSGAQRAFMYLAHSGNDHMKSTVEALKSAGIEFVVFLSSFTIPGDARDIQPSEVIPYLHAQVEINLDATFGPENYVAVRPGGFATNLSKHHKGGIIAGEVKMHELNFPTDSITPGDMGRVCGTILVEGPHNGQQKVYLYGPQVISMGDAIGVIGKVLGKEITVKSKTGEEALEELASAGVPKTLREYLVRVHGNPDVLGRPNYEVGVNNVELYTGRPSTTLEQWVEENKELFSMP